MGGVCIGLDSERAGSRTLEKSSRRDRGRVCAKFERSRRFRGSNMNPKKKSRRCRGLGLDSGLDLAISRFIHSLALNRKPFFLTKVDKIFCMTKFTDVPFFRRTVLFRLHSSPHHTSILQTKPNQFIIKVIHCVFAAVSKRSFKETVQLVRKHQKVIWSEKTFFYMLCR